MENNNLFSKFLTSVKHLFIRLFGFGKHKDAINILEEEALMSPSKMIIRNFFRNRLAVLGVIGFVTMLLLTFGLSAIIPYDERYNEGTQTYLPPNTSYLNFPKQLEKEGVRLIASGNSFSIAISNKGKLYAWGTDVRNIKKDALALWQEHANDITQIAAGNEHVVALKETPISNVWRHYVNLITQKDNTSLRADDGTTWFKGVVIPDVTLGKLGDYYVDTKAKLVYQKTSTEWNVLINLTINTQVDINGASWHIGVNNPNDDFGKVGDYFINTSSWIISKKLESSTKQELLFLGLNSHEQAQIPDWEVDNQGNLITTSAISMKYRAEREAAARYFDTEVFNYNYVNVKNVPVIDYKVEFTDLSKKSVRISYKIEDRDEVIIPGTLYLYYGTKSTSLSYTLKRDRATIAVPIEIPTEAIGGLPFEGEIIADNLVENADYQFLIGYSVVSFTSEGNYQETPNNTVSIALRTAGNGKASLSFRKVPLEINAYSKENVTMPITGITNDPIVMIKAGNNITCVLTKSGKLFTWGSTSSADNRLGNTIKNKVPIVDFSIGRSHVLVLRADNSIDIYGTSVSAISQNLIQKYPYLKLSFDDRIDAIYNQIKYYEAEIAEWQVKIPNLIGGIDLRIQAAEVIFENAKAIYETELVKFEALPKKFIDLKTKLDASNILYENLLFQLVVAETARDETYALLTGSEKSFVDALPENADIKHEYEEAGNDWNPESNLAKYAEILTSIKTLQIDIEETEIQKDTNLAIYEEFETAEIRADYALTYVSFDKIRDDYIDAMDDLEDLKLERYNIANKVSNLRKEIERASSQLTYIEKVVATTESGLALTSDNRLLIWGSSISKLNNIPNEVLKSKIVDIQNGLNHIVVLTSEGKVIAWGRNELNQIDVPKKLNTVDRMYINRFQNYVITSDGNIEAWGNSGYIFGTDSQGRSLFHRILQGGKVSMTVGAIAILISVSIGTTLGLIAGFYGGWIDNLIMRIAEVVNSFPFLPLAITLSSVIGHRMQSDQKMYLIMVILGILSWPGLARLVRGQILSEREKDFVTAARALGIKEKNIILRHILPNVVNIIIVNATLGYAGSLLTEAGLSFLGFGVLPPKPSWGNLLTSAQDISVITSFWWLWILPALFIVITALSINLIGDGLREAMDPKANER